MAIEIVLDVRHHRGRADRWCPRIRCDGCGQLISDGIGNVFWSGDTDEEAPTFAHKTCPDGAHREPQPHQMSEDLNHFLVYLVENAGVDFDRSRPAAHQFADLE